MKQSGAFEPMSISTFVYCEDGSAIPEKCVSFLIESVLAIEEVFMESFSTDLTLVMLNDALESVELMSKLPFDCHGPLVDC